MDALARLIGWKLSLHGVPTEGQVVVTSRGGSANRYPSGTPVTLERICGHRDGDSTSCPGESLYAQLPDLRSRATRYAGPLAGITVRAASRRIRTRPVELSGSLRFPDGSSPAGAPLQIQFAVPGAAFAHIADTVCGADGTWRASVPLAQSGSIRAAFLGDGARPPLASSPITIRVLPLLRMVALVAPAAPRPRRRGLRHRVAEAGVRPRRGPHRAPRRPPLACACSASASTSAAAATSRRSACAPSGLYRVSVLTPGATSRRLLRVL